MRPKEVTFRGIRRLQTLSAGAPYPENGMWRWLCARVDLLRFACCWEGWCLGGSRGGARHRDGRLGKLPCRRSPSGRLLSRARTFDPAAPPADMPPLSTGESAECESNFVSNA